MSDVTDDKKVIKKILKEGEGYEHPNEGSIVKCEFSTFRDLPATSAWRVFWSSVLQLFDGENFAWQ